VTSLSTYASITREITGDRATVTSIGQGDENPHYVQPRPSFLVQLQKADLFVTTGLDLELWVPALLDKANINTAPLVSANGTGYTLASIGADSLAIRGLSITLSGVSIGSLSVTDSSVWLDGSQIGTLTATNSTIVLAHGTRVATLKPALPTISVAGLSQAISSNAVLTVTATGEQLTNQSVTATIDGSRIPLAVTTTSTGATAKGVVNIGVLQDGTHILTVTAKQADGLSTTFTTYFSVATQASAISALSTLVYVLTPVSAAALVLALLALRRRPSLALQAPAPPQV
jgi:hypothetical protein